MNNISSKNSDLARIAFFNERAHKWLDMWYKDPDTGRHDRFTEKFERLFSFVPISSGDHVLDAGCGSGVLVPHFLERIGESGILYELDFAERMIEVNRELHKDKRIRFLTANILDIPLKPESCDVIICFSCFPHFGQKGKAMESIANKLKQNGRFAVAHFDSSDKLNNHHRKAGGPVEHDMLPSREKMFSLCEDAGMSVKEFIDEEGFYLILAKKQKDLNT
ncbi:MAG: class I SAM-dependent methyltransferase [Deltaproteobacteria bacterium]|nr:class I SAM-dependent methyltransferase [Deltaproteobacteria bacterium]